MAVHSECYLNKNIRWGMIGCGKVTETKSAPCYQLIQGFQLTAVAARDQEKLVDYANRHNIPRVFSEIDLMLADKDIDAIYIATPPDSHHGYALKVAAAG